MIGVRHKFEGLFLAHICLIKFYNNLFVGIVINDILVHVFILEINMLMLIWGKEWFYSLKMSNRFSVIKHRAVALFNKFFNL